MKNDKCVPCNAFDNSSIDKSSQLLIFRENDELKKMAFADLLMYDIANIDLFHDEAGEEYFVEKGKEETTKSSDAPWENGCSVALIKSTKRNIVSSISVHISNFSVLQTVVFEVSNLLNERPIGTKTNYPNEGSYLCPNDLLLGRASTRITIGKWDCSNNPRRRWEFIQSIINTYWKKWMRDYFFTLILCQKWHVERRNLQIGDVVLVQDADAIRGHWKLAEVSKANPGSDGKVRDVELRYKIQDTENNYKGLDDKIIRRSAH